MVEQTREEKDTVRREALQDAYDRLTNPSGEAGSMKEVSAQKVAATPAPPTTPTGPTMEELRAGLRESFDRRNAINSEASRKAEIASRPVVIGGVTMPAGYGVPATQAQKDFDAEQQRAARIMDQGPRTPVEDYVEPTPAPVQYKTSAGNPARVTGRLIRDVATGIGESAVRGPQIATEAAKDTVSGMLEGNRKILRGAKGLAKDAVVESLRTRREFLRGLQGQ